MRSQFVKSEIRATSRPRSRRLRQIVRASIAIAIIGVAASLIYSAWPRSATAYEPQLRELTLTASEFDWEIQPGTVVKAWGYNQQMPGPEIRVKEGDRVRITLVNQLPAATTVHWHGVMVPPEMDGPAGLNQAAVEPGETFVYEFIAKPAGTRWYHSHTDVVNQVALGLYGAFIVEPAEVTTTYDQEYTYALAEWDMELTPGVALGTEPRGPRDSELRGGELGTDLFLMNGHSHEAISPIKVNEGDRVLFRLINAGSLGHPIHLHGHLFKIVATDGNPVPKDAQLTKDTVWIAPGERYDIELVADNPGVWMLHCHIENHAANGMMTLIEYDGEVPTGPLGEYWRIENGSTPAMDHASHGSTVGTPAAVVTPEITTEASPVADSPAADGATVVLLDDRFSPKSLSVKVESTVTFVNKGANWHSVSAADGSFTSGMIKPGESFSVTLNSPGTFKYICRQHARHGMIGTLEVTS